MQQTKFITGICIATALTVGGCSVSKTTTQQTLPDGSTRVITSGGGGSFSLVVNGGNVSINGKSVETKQNPESGEGERVVKGSIPVASVRTVTVRNDFGAIAAEPSSDASRISVAATVTLGTNTLSKSDREKYLAGFTVPVAVEGENYTARVIPPADLPNKLTWSVSYRVSVPPSVALDLKSENGAVIVRETNTSGKVMARSDFGAITVVNAGSVVDAQTQNGMVTVEGVAKRESILARSNFGAITVTGPARTIDVKTENGAVKISGAADADKVTARSSFGAIKLEKVGGAVDAQTENGAVHYSGTPTSLVLKSEFGAIEADLESCDGLKDARVTTTNGSVAVTLPRSASVSLVGQTGNGRIQANGFAAQITGDGFDKSLKATLNGGRAPINLSTDFGNLTVTTR